MDKNIYIRWIRNMISVHLVGIVGGWWMGRNVEFWRKRQLGCWRFGAKWLSVLECQWFSVVEKTHGIHSETEEKEDKE